MHSFKWRYIGYPVLLLLILGCLNQVADYMLKPYNYARVDIHNIETKSYDDIFIGSSHGKCGINPLKVDEVTGRKSTNICMGGEYLQDSYYLIREAARKHKPIRVIYELDYGYWCSQPDTGKDFRLFYDEMPLSRVKMEYYFSKIVNGDFRSTLFPWYAYRGMYKEIGKNIRLKQSGVYKNYEVQPFDNAAQSYQEEGFIDRKDSGTNERAEDNLILWDVKKLNQNSQIYFDKLWKFCRENQIELVVVTLPIPEDTLSTYYDWFKAGNDYFKGYMKDRNITYINYNMDAPYSEQVSHEIPSFGDREGHMYGTAANRFSRQLGEDLNGLDKS